MIPRMHRYVLLCSAAAICGCPDMRSVPPPMKGNLVKRDFLEEGTIERSGYGAYSYILMPRSPKTDERYAAILTAFIDNLPRDSHQPGAPLNQINLTYVPVLATTGDRNADWLIKNYDVERAATLMHNVCLTGAGPYIVTATAPLSFQPPRTCNGQSDGGLDLIVIDLSTKPKEMMPPWLGYFARKSDGPKIWKRGTLELVLLTIHDDLGQIGEAFGDVIEALPGGGRVMRFLQ